MTFYDELQKKSNKSLRNALIALAVGTFLSLVYALIQSTIIVLLLFLVAMSFTIVELMIHKRARNKMDDIIDALYDRSRYGK